MRLDDLTVGDVGAEYNATIKADGAALDITGATVTWLLMKGTVKKAQTATIVSETAGTVKYVTQDGDISAQGDWLQQWKVVWPGGETLYFPPKPDTQPVSPSAE